MEIKNHDNTSDSKQVISPSERLRQLRIKQMNASKPGDWTPNDIQELLNLQSLSKQIKITKEHQAALKRQSIADTKNNPPLTSQERKLIQEVNSSKN